MRGRKYERFEVEAEVKELWNKFEVSEEYQKAPKESIDA